MSGTPIDAAQLERLIRSGLTVTEIAEWFGGHPRIIQGWIREWGLDAVAAECRPRTRPVTVHRQVGTCERHGVQDFVTRGDGSRRCVRCRSEAVTEARRRRKALLVAEAGGACRACGYARCQGALAFHHIDPTTKRFAIAHRGASRSLASMRAVAAKCVLLCANCHADIEAGVLEMPLQ